MSFGFVPCSFVQALLLLSCHLRDVLTFLSKLPHHQGAEIREHNSVSSCTLRAERMVYFWLIITFFVFFSCKQFVSEPKKLLFVSKLGPFPLNLPLHSYSSGYN